MATRRTNDASGRSIDAYGLSYVGKARDRNEDCFFVDPDLGLFLVADGMGGYDHGELASRLAVDSIGRWIARAHPRSGPAGEPRSGHTELLRNVIERAHDSLREATRIDTALRRMGTTVVALWLRGGVAALAHIGDSRAYHFSAGRLELLTEDHTWVRQQIAAGELAEREAQEHPHRKMLTQALGTGRVAVDVTERSVRSGDRFLLCSDGLWSLLDDAEIASSLAADEGSERTCRRLAAHANARGALDDLTAVVVRV